MLGGKLLRDDHDLGDRLDCGDGSAHPCSRWCIILTRTTGSGYWEHDLVTLAQRLAEPGQVPESGTAQRLWHVRAGRVILATGCIESAPSPLRIMTGPASC